MKIKVTKEIIKRSREMLKGEGLYTAMCPLAVAIRDACEANHIPIREIQVRVSEVTVNDKIIELPHIAYEFLREFDFKNIACEIEFELDLE